MTSTPRDEAAPSADASPPDGPAPLHPLVRLDDVTRVYGTRAAPVRAVDGISLDFGPGITAVVGPNGAGKTTLLGLVLGFLRPTSGRVTVGGRPPRRWVRRHGAACLPERFRLPPEWTAGAALRAFARLEGLSGDDAAARVETTLVRFGLSHDRDRAIGALSRGTVQRIGLAQALLAQRELVVLDEPTEGLDPLWRVRFRDVVMDLRSAGRTVLLASHELPEVERLADRVVLLRDGRVQEVVRLDAPSAGPLRYRLDAEADPAIIREAFPGAAPAGAAASAGGAPRDGAVVVEVADTRELSDRLAALLARGAMLRAVTPVGPGLEERVRRGPAAGEEP